MRHLLKPLVVLLTIPILASAIGMFGRSQWEARWGTVLVRQLAAQGQLPNSRFMTRFSLAALCSDPRTARRLPPCQTYNLFSKVIGGSALVGGVGFLFLGGVACVATVCRPRPRWFARAFRPTVLLASGGTALLAGAHAALLLVACYLFAETFGRWPTWLIVAAAVAVPVWALGMIAVAFSVSRRVTVTVVGRTVDLSAQPILAATLRGGAGAASAPLPEHVVAGLTPGLFLTEARVACLDAVLTGGTLYLALPLLRILSVDELRALIGHELAHFSGGDAPFATGVSPCRVSVSRALSELQGRARGARAAAIVPPLALLSFAFDALASADVSRAERERRADRSAAGVAGADVFGCALVKAHTFGPAWHTVMAAMARAVAARMQYENSSALFAEVAGANRGPERLRGVGAGRLPHPTDEHPPLSDRLAALGLGLEQVASEALVTSPANPASSLVDGFERLEQELTAVEHRLLAAADLGQG